MLVPFNRGTPWKCGLSKAVRGKVHSTKPGVSSSASLKQHGANQHIKVWINSAKNYKKKKETEKLE